MHSGSMFNDESAEGRLWKTLMDYRDGYPDGPGLSTLNLIQLTGITYIPTCVSSINQQLVRDAQEWGGVESPCVRIECERVMKPEWKKARWFYRIVPVEAKGGNQE